MPHTLHAYSHGESHYYLGKRYSLKIIEAPEQVEGVKLLGGTLEVWVRSKNAKQVHKLLVNWYKNRAKDTFNKRLDILLDQTPWIQKHPQVHLITMQDKWGSCSPQGCLTLNPHLIKAPLECIDYVILHELCHIIENDHNDKFYGLMNFIMPQWEKNKQKLNSMPITTHCNTKKYSIA